MVFIICGILIILFFLISGSSLALNAGTLLGAGFGLSLVFCGIFRKKFSRNVRRTLGLFYLLAALTLTAAVTAILSGSHHTPPAEEDITVIVLGCRVWGSEPSPMLARRIHTAYLYLKDHPEASCICSGGQGNDENISEAACIYRELNETYGISEDRLFLEDRSTSTYENLSFSQEIIQKEGLCEQVGIATNDYHEYRSLRLARDLGMTAYAIPGSTQPLFIPTYYLRESAAILKVWIFGK